MSVCSFFLNLNVQFRYVFDYFMLGFSFFFLFCFELTAVCTACISIIFFHKLMPLSRNKNDEDKEHFD